MLQESETGFHAPGRGRRSSRSGLIRAILLGVLFTNVQAATGDGSPSDANLKFVGRWDVSTPDAPHSYWGGAYVRTGFTGSTLSVKLGKSADIAVFIDDNPVVIKTAAKGTVPLATGLAAGEHTVKLVARQQADQIVFQGFVLASGAGTLPAAPAKGLIEFIGNSITSGATTTNGNVSAFPWLVGETLGADRTAISYPGITLVDGYSYGGSGVPCHGMNLYWTKTVTVSVCPDKTVSASDWDFTRYAADLVVINLGTNDKNLSVPSDTFKTDYALFIKLVRSKFPNAHIFGMRTYGGYYEAETRAAVDAVVAAGDKKVHYINTTGWLGSSDFASDGAHPTDAGHVKAAGKLAPILKPYLDSLRSPTSTLSKSVVGSGSAGIRLTRHLTLGISADGRGMAGTRTPPRIVVDPND